MRKQLGTTIIQGDITINKLAAGVREVADMVKSTMGPMGKNIIIEKVIDYPIITKDGVTVAKSVNPRDPIVAVGAKLCQEAAAKTDSIAGDGTTTTVVLIDAMVREGMKLLAAGYNPIQLRTGMNIALKQALEYLQQHSQPADSLEKILSVAAISAKDQATGSLIAEAVDQVGLDGIITVKASQQQKTFVHVTQGMHINKGYVTTKFIAKGEKMTVELEDVMIFLTDCAFTESIQMEKIVNLCLFEKKNLLVVANDIRRDSLGVLLNAKNQGAIQTVAISAPGFGLERLMTLDDIAAATGGQTVSEALGSSLEKSCKKSFFGHAKRVVVTGSDTYIIDGSGSKDQIEQRQRQIKAQIAQATSPQEATAMRKRLASLAGGIAVIEVGGTTELEMKEAKYRIEDGVNAARASMKHGILPGGGKALWATANYLKEQIPMMSHLQDDGTKQGYEIVHKAFLAPINQILINAGLDMFDITHDWQNNDFWQGWDVVKEAKIDLLQGGVVDPTLVITTAISNSVSIVSTLLTADGILGEPKFFRSRLGDADFIDGVETGVKGVTWG